jgi:hypothetical protein
MDMIEQPILQALQQAIVAAVAASSIPTMIVKPLGITGPGTGTAFIEIFNIPNNRQGDYWDDSRVYQGTFRILLHWPNDGKGAYPPSRYRDELAGYFPKGRTITVSSSLLKIYGYPDASSVLEAGQELVYPLSLLYRCFRA